MGLLVPEFVLPNGTSYSNVYISFTNCVVYTHPICGQDYQMSCMARVYQTPDDLSIPIFEFPVEIPNSDLTKGPFVNMYTALKALFPLGKDYQN